MGPFSKNFDFNLRRDHKKSYDRRDYESVDEKKAYLRLCPEKNDHKNSGGNGLIRNV